MTAALLYLGTAFYLGVLTSISPCPLATNIAAVSYVGRKVGNPRAVLAAGFLYTLGRCLLYLGLAIFLAAATASLPTVSRCLQTYGHMVLGPILIIVGMFLVGLIVTNLGGASLSEGMQQRIDTMGLRGAFLLGVLFAVSFCPTSAMWFFGLVGMILGSGSGFDALVFDRLGITLPEQVMSGAVVSLPLAYGVGTGLPVLLLTTLLAYGVQSVGKLYNVLSQVEWWTRQVLGRLLVLIGVYFSLKFVFEAIP